MKYILKSCIQVLLIFLFLGCDLIHVKGSRFISSENYAFITPPLGGISYFTSSDIQGVTDSDGEFSYNDSDTITFHLGKIILGTIEVSDIEASSTITLFDILGLKEYNDMDDTYIMVWQFLFSLNHINSSDIYIKSSVRKQLNDYLKQEIEITKLNRVNLKKLLSLIGKNLVDRQVVLEYFENPKTIWWYASEGYIVDANVSMYRIYDNNSTKLLYTDITRRDKYAHNTAKFNPHIDKLNPNYLYLYKIDGGYKQDANFDGLIDKNVSLVKGKDGQSRIVVLDDESDLTKNNDSFNLFFKGSWLQGFKRLKITSMSNILYDFFTYEYSLKNLDFAKRILDIWTQMVLLVDLNSDGVINAEDLYLLNFYLDRDKVSNFFTDEKYEHLIKLMKQNNKQEIFEYILLDTVLLTSLQLSNEAIGLRINQDDRYLYLLDGLEGIAIIDNTDYLKPFLFSDIDPFLDTVDMDLYTVKTGINSFEDKLLTVDKTGVFQLYNIKKNSKVGVFQRIFTNRTDIKASSMVDKGKSLVYFDSEGMKMISINGSEDFVNYLGHTIPEDKLIDKLDMNRTENSDVLMHYDNGGFLWTVIGDLSNGLRAVSTYKLVRGKRSAIDKAVPELMVVHKIGYFESPKQIEMSYDNKRIYILDKKGIQSFKIIHAKKFDRFKKHPKVKFEREKSRVTNTDLLDIKKFVLLDNDLKSIVLTNDNKIVFYDVENFTYFEQLGHHIQMPEKINDIKLSTDKKRLIVLGEKNLYTLDISVMRNFGLNN